VGSDIGVISSGLVCSDLNGLNFRDQLFLGHGNRDFRAIGLRKPGLVLQSRRHGTIADFVRVAEFIEIEQFRRQRFAAGMALTLLLVDMQPQLGGFRHSTKLPLYRRFASAFAQTRQLVMISASIDRDGALFLLL
jgi:hypothetical protein